MKIKIGELEKVVKQILLKEYSSKEADLIKDVVMYGELSGKPSHGLIRLFRGKTGVFSDNIKDKPKFHKKTKVSTLIDGKGNVGMLVSSLAMEEVIRLGKKHDVGIVGTKGIFSTSGALAYYCEKIAKENLIAFIFAQSSPAIAPFSAMKPLFGTNPVAFGIPSNPNPIVFDMSTSAVTIGTLYKYKLEGKKLPYNVAIDVDGNATTDPEKALKGSLLAFDDSYKGSGLAMMVEILGGLWNEASFAGRNSEEGWGNLFMAFSPNLLSSVKTFKQNSEELINTLKHIKTRDEERLRIPGENSQILRSKNLEKGIVEIDDVLFRLLQSKYGV